MHLINLAHQPLLSKEREGLVNEPTIVSRVSAHGRLNIHRDFGLHGRLPGT